MNRSTRVLSAAALLTAAAFAGAWAPSRSGPPMVCNEVQVDSEHQSSIEKLPITGADPIGHSLAALSASPDFFSHMEIVRRLCMNQQGHSDEVIHRLMQRVVDGEAVGKVGSNEWLDLAYAVGCFNQLGETEFKKGQSAPGERDGIPGYWYMLRAINLESKESRGSASTLHFAAALLTHPIMASDEQRRAEVDERYRFHLREAVRGMSPGSLLEKNMQANLTSYQGAIERARKELAAEGQAKDTTASSKK
ncbi:MAG: hypothetical protein IT434_07740 [Phycisphaerales bacterium]|nr:hypothetical protein [Phycisphaerales bacterium]